MVSRASVDMWPEAADVAGQAHALRTWAMQLAQVNMEVYGSAKEALTSAYAGGGETDSLKDSLGEAMEVREFSTFAPAAIAMIGHLPGTLADRSVAIALKRKREEEATPRPMGPAQVKKKG